MIWLPFGALGHFSGENTRWLKLQVGSVAGMILQGHLVLFRDLLVIILPSYMGIIS